MIAKASIGTCVLIALGLTVILASLL